MTPIHGTRSRIYFETAIAFAWLIIEIAYLLIAMVGFVVVVAMLYQTVAYGQAILACPYYRSGVPALARRAPASPAGVPQVQESVLEPAASKSEVGRPLTGTVYLSDC